MIAGAPDAAPASPAPSHEELINMPYAQARERLLSAAQGGELFVRVLAPPHPSIGVGVLRVVRATPVDGGLELVLTYSDFVRP